MAGGPSLTGPVLVAALLQRDRRTIVTQSLAVLTGAVFGLLAVPQNFYAGLSKYPLLAIPMFVLVGAIFDRSGVAQRLVNFALAIVGRGPGMLPLVAIAVAMFMGGISGSGPANAAAVGGVMIAAIGAQLIHEGAQPSGLGVGTDTQLDVEEPQLT